MFSTKNRISLDKIKQKVNEYSLWCYYTGLDIKLGQKIISPVRSESDSYTSAFFNIKDTILLKDFKTGKIYSILAFLKAKFGFNQLEALQQINSDFDLGYPEPEKVSVMASNAVLRPFKIKDLTPGINTKIKVQRKPWSQAELEYWFQYHITQESLEKFNISPLQRYWVQKYEDYREYNRKKNELVFVFSFGYAKYKIYKPLGDKKEKWLSNVNKDTLMGYSQLESTGKKLIITKGMKELLICTQLGFNALAVQGEQSYPSKDKLQELKDRFQEIYILFDIDKPGKEGAREFKRISGFKEITLPSNKGSKDLAGITKREGLKYIKQFLHDNI